MWSHHPETDLIGTIHDLDLPSPAAALMLHAASRVSERGLRACLTSVILSSAPHRYARLPGPPGTRYQGPGGRALRAGVMGRAIILLSLDIGRAREELIVSAVLANLSPGSVDVGSLPCARANRRWLAHVMLDEADHLARWGCDADQMHRILTLTRHADTQDAWDRRTCGRELGPVQSVMALACRATHLAGLLADDFHARRPARWLDPVLPDIEAASHLREALRRIP